MFTYILLASDGSACALKAAAVAAALARKFGARLTVVNVFEPIPIVGTFWEMVEAGLEDRDMMELQERAVTDAGCTEQEIGVPFQSRQEVGRPAAEIVRVAEAEGCDLIILGSRGSSGLSSLALGSVSDHVAHHAHCPVLIVK